MGRIKQLAPHEAHKIAAGEVVERPANVVKELVENALDAGASALVIALHDGGKERITISDNGSGMTPEDARMCINHHATSKITTVDDLASISTFGFRGEALSSICSVARVVIKTKEAHQQAGVQLTISESTIIHETPVACNTGTEITVSDLFYNVPARKKFLKTKETEWRAITQLFNAFCLAYPAIHFTLYSDDKLVHNCPAAPSLAVRLAQLHDRALTNALLPLEQTHERMSLTVRGVITDTHYARYDRNSLFLFVNQRWIKNTKLVQSLLRGYQGSLPTEKYPAAFLFITIDQQYIDINIHPRKEEVQFLHPRIVEQCIETAVKKRLEDHVAHKLGAATQAPSWSAQPAFKSKSPFMATPEYTPLDARPQPAHTEAFARVLDSYFTVPKPPTAQEETQSLPLSNSPELQSTLPVSTHPDSEYKLLAQLASTYLLLETAEGLTLIDQHAAHERIIYEQLRNHFGTMPRMRLLFPMLISVHKDDLVLLTPYLEELQSYGLVLEQVSDTQLAVQEAPAVFKSVPYPELVQYMISCIKEHQSLNAPELRKKLHEKLHAQMSCKAAVKAGDELSSQAMHELIRNLHGCDNKLTCPHGRPTTWLISHYELKKKFKRDYQ